MVLLWGFNEAGYIDEERDDPNYCSHNPGKLQKDTDSDELETPVRYF